MDAATRIGPATADDLPLIAECVGRFRLDDEDLRAEQFLVARRNGHVVAFGRIKPYPGGVYELCNVGVLEPERGRGLGAAIVHALISRFPTPDVWITTDLASYFERFGFRAAHPPAPIAAKLAGVCARLRVGVIAMRLTRSAASFRPRSSP